MKTQILKDFTQQGTGRRAGNADCGGDAGKSHVGGWGREKERGRDNFFILILKYLLPAPWIDYLEHLEDFYPIGFFFVEVKVS